MSALVIGALLLFAMVPHSSGAVGGSWCVCKQGVKDKDLQTTLDFACGAGADCNPTHKNGPCFNPDTLLAHCNYAVNSYYQKKSRDPEACNFSGTAAVVTSDPSTSGCAYPTSASGGTTPVSSTTPTSGNPTTPSGTTSPYVTNPSTGGAGGVLGGAGTGLGPSGVGSNNDESDGGVGKTTMLPFLIAIMISGLFVLL